MAKEAERGARGQRGQDARRVAVERERDHRQGGRRDHADAGGEPVDPVGQVDDVHDRDDARRRSGPLPGRSSRRGRRSPDRRRRGTGSVNAVTVTPAETGMIVAAIWPGELDRSVEVEDVVDDADGGDRDGTRQDRARLLAAQARRPSAGRGFPRRGRRPGSPGRRASASAPGGGFARSGCRSRRSSARSTRRPGPEAARARAATPKAKTASIVSGTASISI